MEAVARVVAIPASEPNLSTDLLRGADAIAEFLYGDAVQRRKIYHLAETSRLPIFRLGSVLCARRSILIQWIADQERRGWRREPLSSPNHPPEPPSLAHPNRRAMVA